MSLTTILLDVLYGVLILAVGGVGTFLALTLWQVMITISQARTVLLPHVHQLLEETERITGEVDATLGKVDQTVAIANSAVAAVGQTTELVNRQLAIPLVNNLTCLVAGLQAGARYYAAHRNDRAAVSGPALGEPQPARKA